ncbi:Zinc finger protein ZAT11 [Glycine max]|nr:Zinc finger protein ZAT11 [Glycine max]
MLGMKRHRDNEGSESLDLAKCLVLFSCPIESNKAQQKGFGAVEFECKTCSRKFSSFQALGGHRASHKRQKLEGEELKEQAKTLSLWNKPKMHECSICGLEFSLGQALGGHMRKHRAALNEGFPIIPSIDQVIAKIPVLKRSNSTRVMCLDLELHLESEEVKSIVTSVCLKMLSQAGDSPTREVFECKTCNRKFTSFQALGGHRASHKSLSGSGTGRPHEKTHRRCNDHVLQPQLNAFGSENHLKFLFQITTAPKRQRDFKGFESIDLANCLMMLSHPQQNEKLLQKKIEAVEFECKTCNRKFSSFQALVWQTNPKCTSVPFVDKNSHWDKHLGVITQMPVLKRSNSTRVVTCLDLNLTPLENDLKLLFGKMAPNAAIGKL